MPWIYLDDVRAHLNKTSPADDAELVGFIDAACAMIEDLKGHVDVVTVTETQHAKPVDQFTASWDSGYYGGVTHRAHLIVLRQWPVLSIGSVQVASGGTPAPVSAGDPMSGALGWRLNDQVLTVPQRGVYQVTYQAGRDPVPANYRLAALDLVQHLWNRSQTNAGAGGRPQINAANDQTAMLPHMASALPYAIRELLGIYGEISAEQIPIA